MTSNIVGEMLSAGRAEITETQQQQQRIRSVAVKLIKLPSVTASASDELPNYQSPGE